jgi:ribosomal protein S18 acetylase RimI-like enzyme
MTRPGTVVPGQAAKLQESAVSSLRFRPASGDDAARIAALHADSWRRHYRGAYSDSFLDGDLLSDRRTVWEARLAAPAGTRTVIAENDARLAGFVHIVLDEDPVWGSLVDNLHVAVDQHRSGIGRRLMGFASQAVISAARDDAMYLWVLRQNVAAQGFYRALGGREAEIAKVGGDPARLSGTPEKLRMVFQAGRNAVPSAGS